MTRINVISTKELSDQWLIAEYRELPRVIKQHIDIRNAPEIYCLGKGHVKWAKLHSWWCLCRYKEICNEMIYRGFTVNYPYEDLLNLFYGSNCGCDYVVTSDDIILNRQRLIEKYKMKPNYYRWTNREKPKYFQKN